MNVRMNWMKAGPSVTKMIAGPFAAKRPSGVRSDRIAFDSPLFCSGFRAIINQAMDDERAERSPGPIEEFIVQRVQRLLIHAFLRPDDRKVVPDVAVPGGFSGELAASAEDP